MFVMSSISLRLYHRLPVKSGKIYHESKKVRGHRKYWLTCIYDIYRPFCQGDDIYHVLLRHEICTMNSNSKLNGTTY